MRPSPCNEWGCSAWGCDMQRARHLEPQRSGHVHRLLGNLCRQPRLRLHRHQPLIGDTTKSDSRMNTLISGGYSASRVAQGMSKATVHHQVCCYHRAEGLASDLDSNTKVVGHLLPSLRLTARSSMRHGRRKQLDVESDVLQPPATARRRSGRFKKGTRGHRQLLSASR